VRIAQNIVKEQINGIVAQKWNTKEVRKYVKLAEKEIFILNLGLTTKTVSHVLIKLQQEMDNAAGDSSSTDSKLLGLQR
jgi:hypothetical protein